MYKNNIVSNEKKNYITENILSITMCTPRIKHIHEKYFCKLNISSNTKKIIILLYINKDSVEL